MPEPAPATISHGVAAAAAYNHALRVVPRGQGVLAVEDVIRRNLRIAHARSAMHQVRAMAQPVALEEMLAITEVWVDTALQLGEKSLRTMERLVRAQYRRHGVPTSAQA